MTEQPTTPTPSSARPNAAVPPPTPAARPSDRLVALLLAFGTLALFLLLHPFVGGPQNDDFSYAHTALGLAQTGHMVYNGWGTPLLLPQAAVGALLIRAFGFSYLPLEWFGLLCEACLVAVIFLFARRACGLGLGPALLVTAVAALNPIAIPNAPSFMTDVPGALLVVLSVWMLASAIHRDPEDDASALYLDGRHLLLATLLGLLAGANRQTGWLAFLGAVVPLPFLLRGRFAGRDRLRCLLIIAAIVAAAGIGTLWFNRQPYTIGADVNRGFMVLFVAPNIAAMLVYRLLNELGLFLLPATLPAMIALAANRRRRPIRLLLLVALAVLAFLPPLYPLGTAHLNLLTDHYGPSLYGQYLTQAGVLVGGVRGFEGRPAVFGPTAVEILVFAGAVGMVFSGYLLLAWAEDLAAGLPPLRRRKHDAAAAAEPARVTLPLSDVAVTLAAASSLAQIIVSVPWYAQFDVFDRYLLLLLPGLLVVHARQAQEYARETASGFIRAVWGLVGVLALAQTLWGSAAAAEYWAYGRARMTLYRRLLAGGVPRTAIDGGVELNGETQIEVGGYINNDLIKYPPDAYRKASGSGVSYQADKFPAISAQYALSTEDDPDPSQLLPEPVKNLTYESLLLPPRTRRMYVYRINRPAAGVDATPSP